MWAFIKSLVAPLGALVAFFTGKRSGYNAHKLESSQKAADAAIRRVKSDARIDSASDDDIDRMHDEWNR